MEFPDNLHYTKEHEWVRVEEDGTIVVGITDYAQEQLGDIVYLELPNVGDQVHREEAFATVESVKAVSEIYAPVSGTVKAVNDGLSDTPETLNGDPYEGGWLVRITMSSSDEIDGLMSPAEYKEFVEAEEGG